MGDEPAGSVYVARDDARALAHGVDLPASKVLNCSGEFEAGDLVFIVSRGIDGGQGVVAIGRVRIAFRDLAEGADSSEIALSAADFRTYGAGADTASS